MGIEEIFEAILGGAQKQPEKQFSRDQRAPRRSARLEPVPQPKGDGNLGDVLRSFVQIVALREGFLGGMRSAWTGSGTIVHPQGLILTNCHVATRERWPWRLRLPIEWEWLLPIVRMNRRRSVIMPRWSSVIPICIWP